MSNQIRSRRKNENTAVQRLKKDYLRLCNDPIPYISATPDPKNILEWHYVLKGAEGTPFHGGYYHGVIKFPAQFPYSAPSLSIITPNGRFKTNTKLCMSNSNFHQETWCPTWSAATILTGLLSFMNETSKTYGSIETTDAEKRQLAKESLRFNIENAQFVELFPELAKEINEKLAKENKSSTKSKDEQKNNQQTNLRSNNNASFDRKKILQSIVLNSILVFAFIIVIFLIKYIISLTA